LGEKGAKKKNTEKLPKKTEKKVTPASVEPEEVKYGRGKKIEKKKPRREGGKNKPGNL